MPSDKDIDKFVDELMDSHSRPDILKFVDIMNDVMIMQGDKSALILKSHRNITNTLQLIMEKYILPHKIEGERLENIINFFKNTEKMCNDFKEFLDKGD